MKKGDIVGYTREYLDTFKESRKKEARFVIISDSILSDNILIKDKDDKTEFTKQRIAKYWLYVVEDEKLAKQQKVLDFVLEGTKLSGKDKTELVRLLLE